MKVPARLLPLVDQGVIDEVLRPLMSGKEADVFLVISEGERRVAKVYKEAEVRAFKHRAEYTEGRKVRNSRQQRAMAKNSRYGKEQIEAAWRSAEVDAIYRLRAAGVRTPVPHHFVDGVLVMELITGDDGQPAPRLVDVDLDRDAALGLFRSLLAEVVKMLCAGVVHGDLSDFNVLIGPNGPVIIDFPQAVDAAHNRNARKLLVRDVDNLTAFIARHVPKVAGRRYGEEIWALYEANQLAPGVKLTGRFEDAKKKADTHALLDEIEAAQREWRERRESLGLSTKLTARAPKVAAREVTPVSRERRGPADARRSNRPTPPPAPARIADDLDALLIVGD